MSTMMHSRLLLICCVIYSVIWLSSAHQCGKNEWPVECIDQCQTCEYKDGGCAQPAVCIKGCDCVPGFFRNEQNECIPAAFCPAPGPTQQCGPYEIPVQCIDQCQTCQYKNGNCSQGAVCIPGCDCIPGFLRNQRKQCIPANSCPGTGPGPAQQCPPYEYPVGCIDRCQRCEFKNGDCAQIQVCTPGCNCVPGFLRDSTNKCIPADFCPAPTPTQQCGQYEIPVQCINQCQTCQYKNGNCSQGTVCIPGCDCIPGFLRNQQKQCIPAYRCPGTGPGPSQQCPPYEYPVPCVDRCQRCEYKNGNCGQGQVCTPGCNCVPGFLRDKTNKCIPANSCPDQCKSDEQYYSDIPDCKNTCENYNNPDAICPQYFAPRPGCFCAIGLVKRKDGKCVKPENCFPPGPPQQCPAGEIPVECIDRCQRCEYKDGNCVQIQVCTPGCNCLPGFLRDSTNKCIPANVCPGTGPGPAQQCPPYEYPVECIDRCQRCEYKNGICNQTAICIPGCNCIPGFLRDGTNKCIRAEFCPGTGPGPAQQCPPYEYPVECIDRCQRCEYKNGICNQTAICIPGCNCLPGFLRDGTNKCIRADTCPGTGPGPAQQCPPYEYPVECIDRCQRCEYKNGICNQTAICIPGCNCLPGFLRDGTNKCIRADTCPGTGPGPAQQCPPYEYPVECIDRCQRCEYKNGICNQTAICIPGCNCLPGFLRDGTNKCIRADSCPGTGPGPAQQCPPYEYPVECIDRCQRCEYKNGICNQTAICIPGCNCLPGFLRDGTNKCIRADSCPGTGPGPAQQCPPYEYPVECIDRCQRCEYKNGICNQTAICIPGCNCLPGFLRDGTNKCIRADSCPGPGPAQQCGIYEIPVQCIDQCQTCKYKNGGCVQPAVCIPGCNCVQGFFRNEKNQCVPANSCPAPTQQCGKYEKPVECIDQCQTCEYRNGGCAQPAVCIPGCDCIPGFFRNKQKQCIPAAFCPGTGPGPAQQCPPYEYPVQCIDRCQTCEYKNGNCVQIGQCTPGCNCVPGYLRDKTKKCIPAIKCP